MSYILDALRKADAERERGQVPGIHAQQLALASSDTEGPGHSHTLLWASVGLSAALLAMVALLAWHSFGREQAPLVAAASRPIPITPAEPAATLAVAGGPIATAASPAAAVVATTAPAPPVSQKHPSVQAEARQATPRQAATKHAPARHAPKPLPAKRAVAPAAKIANAAVASATSPDKTTQVAAAEPTSTPRIDALKELPADIRQQLPTLTIGGASYSSNPSSRMLIVNGQVFHERDRLTPELQLLQIRLKSAVLDFKGYRYEIKY